MSTAFQVVMIVCFVVVLLVQFVRWMAIATNSKTPAAEWRCFEQNCGYMNTRGRSACYNCGSRVFVPPPPAQEYSYTAPKNWRPLH